MLVMLALVLFTGFRYVVPLTPSPEPTGENKVLTDTVYYRYESDIAEMLTDGNEREIPVKVWYPENMQSKKHPLLVFSHGSFGVSDSNQTLFLELASRGYIVMSLSHPHHSFKSKMSNGKSIMVDFDFIKATMSSKGTEDLEGTLESLRGWTQIRIDDIDLVLDKIFDSNADNTYEQFIDAKRVVLSGHSLGGTAALAVGRQRNKDIKALIILESPFAADIIGIDGDKYVFTDEEYPLPVLHIYSDSLFPRIDETTIYDMNTRLIKSENPMYVNEHIEGAGHIGLTDMSLVSPIITNLIDRGLNKRNPSETLLELNGYVLKFLDKYNN
ncbi:MAG: alpha/beta hydrolase family protein [Lachnospiraceae bacterium]